MDIVDDNIQYIQARTPKALSDIETSKDDKLIPLWKLFQYANTTDKILITLGSILALATGVAQPIQILFFGDILNAFNPTKGLETNDEFQSNINKIVLKFVYLGIAVVVAAFGQVACWSIAASRQSKRIRHAYTAAILRQEIGWFDKNEPMQLASRVADSTLLVQNGIGRKIGDGLNFTGMGIGSIVTAFYYGWKLSLVLVAFTPLIALSAYYMSKSIASAVQGGVDAYAEAGGIAEEALSNIKTVYMFNAMESIATKYKNALEKSELAGVKKGLAMGLGTGVMFFFTFVTFGVGMYYGAVKITNDQANGCFDSGCYNGGRVMTVFFCIIMGAMALGESGPSIQAIYTARAAAQEIFGLIARVSAIDPNDNSGRTLDGTKVSGAIKLNNIVFAYPTRPDVVVCRGYSLSIPAGQKIALVGSSGSGKSTIVSLLERFYDPLEGSITLDGIDTRTLNIGSLRRQIGLVSQEPSLFSDSIANNIKRGRPDATIEEVHEAAKQANAYNFIMAFPDGFDTMVGDRGTQLSGGQKQRIAIARAIIKNPAVLLLDEATSALDAESEHIVQASLDQLVASRRRTTIIIAHRLSTIRNADRIVVLSDGVVVEDGSHDELLEIENGHYKTLVKSQVRSEDHDTVNSDIDNDYDTEHTVASKNNHGDSMTTANDSVVTMTSQKDKPAPISRVWKLGWPEIKHYIIGSIGAFVHGAVYPVWGILLARCVILYFRTDIDSSEMRRLAMWWGLSFALLGLVYMIALVTQCHQLTLASERLTSRLRVMSFSSMLRQDMTWYDDPINSSGALTTGLATDSGAIRVMTSETLNAILVNAASLGVGFGIGFYYSWKMTLVLLAIFPILGFASVVEMQNYVGTDKALNNGDVMAGALLSEAINSIRTVASFGLEQDTQSLYLSHLLKSRATDIKVALKSAAAYSVSQATMFFAIALTFYYGGYLLVRNQVTFEEMITVLDAIIFGSIGVGIAMEGISDVGKAKKSVQRIFSIIDRVPAIDSMGTGGIALEHVDGELDLQHLQFTYPSRPNSKIYTDYSLKIASGQTVALVGSSGCGKSTAISLIDRFYDPTFGNILLDGTNLKDINIQSLRNHISIVSQEPVLFSGTVADNIRLGKPNATLDEVIEAAKQANAHDFISLFPEGYDTSVGDRGVQVSGGQKQRIAIARAIIRDPAILLLDEATSALDTESERIVQASLDQLLLLKRRTTIIVAHRLSTIRNADVIAVLNDGRVGELGTHDQLMTIPNGLYKNLVSLQVKL
ncbi:ATP-binding Cassette (ABC) Superfamily [Thraustotheca clavata]|uniref:ATP-binding Cassette (ABC) Superfamily n=1 Tax=Thraustotheca clavata TaxID=74557 RepID=A0A1V9ZX38_9STRA|nr:ATP-binding Cassette (ABC) Superfamily [Thraustotheca clavata]